MTGSAGAWAGEWRITPSLAVEETFTDNVAAAPEGQEKTDFVTSVSPGLSVRGSGGRVSLNFDYALQRLVFLKDSSRNEFRHSLAGNGSAEIAKDVLFLNAQASISQQTVSNTGAVSASELNDNPNRQTVQTYSIGPIVRHRFGNWAEAEATYNFTRTDVGGEAVSDSNVNSARATLRSGTRFSRFLWSLTGSRSETSRSSGASDNSRTTTIADLEYVVSRKVSMLAGIGFEKLKDATLTTEPDGLIWDAGLRLRPGPRTSLVVTYNDRYDDTSVGVDASYLLGSSTRISLTYSESIQTTEGQLSQDLEFVGVDDSGTLIDTRTGLPFSAGDPAFGLTTNAFRQKRLSLSLSGSRRRNTFSLQGFRETRETDATGTEETSFGVTVGFSRRLSRRADTSLGVSYRNTDFGTADGREDDFYSVSAGFTYRISQGLNGALSYNLTKRDSTTGGNDLTENAVTVRVQKTF